MGPWRARWIWAGAPSIETDPGAAASVFGLSLDPDGFDRWVLLRRSFFLERSPQQAFGRVTADSRYLLYVNESEVASGPIRDHYKRLHFDPIEIAHALRPGSNTIAALVRFYGRPTPWWMPAHPNFSLGGGCFAFEVKLGESWLVSDADWKGIVSDAWSAPPPRVVPGPPIEVHDARRLPERWNATDFDDAGWPAATVLDVLHVGASGSPHPPSDPFGALPARPIPPLEGVLRVGRLVDTALVHGGAPTDDPVLQVDADEQRTVLDRPEVPGSRMRLEDPKGVALLTFDFGEEVAGRLGLEVEASPGAQFDVCVAEALDPGSGRLRRESQHAGLRYVARGSGDRFESFDPMGFRYAKIAVRAGSSPFAVVEVKVRERLYPQRGDCFFRASDERLTRLYDAGVRTVALNAQDAYLDCPSREQRAWTGDAVVHQMVHLATNEDWGLARRWLDLANAPLADGMIPMAPASDAHVADGIFIPDWPLHWVHGVHNLYRYTGDRERVARLLPSVENLLRWFVPFQSPCGLLRNVTGWVLLDWASVYRRDTSSVLNALWARSLGEFAEMASWLGDANRAAWARRVFEQVREGFELFWDEERGGYVDHAIDGAPQRPMSQHASSAAIVAGLAPPERWPRLLDLLTDRDRLVRRSWIFDAATADTSLEEAVVATDLLLRAPPPPNWDVEKQIVASQPFFRYIVHDALARAGGADRLLDLYADWFPFQEGGAKTLPESWSGGSRCHGWASTPSRDLIVYTLGIRPDAPGFSSIRVAPRLGHLDWAEGRAPTPAGPITVRADPRCVAIETPSRVVLDLPGAGERWLEPGSHRVVRS